MAAPGPKPGPSLWRGLEEAEVAGLWASARGMWSSAAVPRDDKGNAVVEDV